MVKELGKLQMLCSSCHRDIHDQWDRENRERNNLKRGEKVFQASYDHHREVTEKFLDEL